MMNEMTDPTNPPPIDDENQKKNERLLEKMLDAHQKWIMAEEGRRARKFCAKDFIRNCEGDARLEDFNFKGRSLQHAVFDDCSVQYVDFTDAKLNSARFIGANARGAIFNGADCTDADFDDCDLRYAEFSDDTKLNWANFNKAYGPIVTGSFGMHPAIAYAGVAAIGCETHTLGYWQEHGRDIAAEHGYSDVEIEAYMNWIQSAKKILKEMNHE